MEATVVGVLESDSEGSMKSFRNAALYVIVFSTALAGMLGLSWWSSVAGACALSLQLMAEDSVRVDGDAAAYDAALVVTNLVIAAVAAPAAFLGGRLTALAWGL